MDRGYDRDYDADFADMHQVPVEPMGMWGLKDRSRRWARPEDRWGMSERSRRPGMWRGEQRFGQEAPRPWGPGDRDYERERGWRQVDRESGLGWQRPGRDRWRGDWNQSGEPWRYDRDFSAGYRGRDPEWPPWRPGPGYGYGADFTGDQARSGRGYSREYGRLRRGQGREDMPWDIERPGREGPIPGYPRRETSDAWGVYRPAWFGGRPPGADRDPDRGAWSYRASRRGMFEATGARSRPVGRDRHGGYPRSWRRGGDYPD